MPSHTTLQAARRQLATQMPAGAADDPILAEYISIASQAVDDFCGRYFEETVNIFNFNGEVGTYNPILFLNGRDLLTPTSFLNGDGSVIAPQNYQALPPNNYPKTSLRIALGNYFIAANQVSSTCPIVNPLLESGYAVDALQVAGTWGFHRNYPNAWVNTGLTVVGAVLATATSITLSAAPGVLLDVGSVLRITSTNGTEYLNLIGPVASSTPTGFTSATITVVRNFNNLTSQNTAVAFNGGEAVYVWRCEQSVELATRMLVAATYTGRSNATGERTVIPGLGAIGIPAEFPPKVLALLRYPFWSDYYGQVISG